MQKFVFPRYYHTRHKHYISVNWENKSRWNYCNFTICENKFPQKLISTKINPIKVYTDLSCYKKCRFAFYLKYIINPFKVIVFLVIRINLFFDMSLKFRNYDHKFLHPIINISRSQDTLCVTHDPMDFKGIFSETIYFKKILFSKLIHIIHYLDNLFR